MRPDELIVDSFAGGGGASLGITWALGRHPDLAINHDAEAIALHAANHPTTRHFNEDVWDVDPLEATGGRPVGLMWLSPDCKHFSKAKGGKPVSHKVRGLAWVAVRWAKAVQPRVIVLENVEEFQTWGPLGPDRRPCPQRKGKTFRHFVARLRNLGYAVEFRELRACDFGAPTIRKRLFIVARRDGQPIVWPTPTHGKGRPLPWRTAGECIDWSVPCPSIFTRARPLAENTLRRIARGLRKFVFDSPRPFIVPMQHDNRPVGVDEPLQTVTTQGNKFNVVVPQIVNMAHGGKLEDPAAPLSTIATEKGGCRALVEAFLVNTRNGERTGQAPRVRDLAQPYATVTGMGSQGALVEAFLAKHYGGHETPGASLFDPVPTVTTQDHSALTLAHLEVMHGTGEGRAVDAPAPAVLAQGNHLAEVRAFLVAYYGNEQDGGDLFDPLRTLSTRDRFGLVTVNGHEYLLADIGMRMLTPRELYRAQGFPDSYRIETRADGRPMPKTAQVRMVGNSVCPPVAAAIVRANLGATAAAPIADEVAA